MIPSYPKLLRSTKQMDTDGKTVKEELCKELSCYSGAPDSRTSEGLEDECLQGPPLPSPMWVPKVSVIQIPGLSFKDLSSLGLQEHGQGFFLPRSLSQSHKTVLEQLSVGMPQPQLLLHNNLLIEYQES